MATCKIKEILEHLCVCDWVEQHLDEVVAPHFLHVHDEKGGTGGAERERFVGR